MIFLERPQIELLYKGTKVQIQLDKKDAADIVNAFSGIEPGEDLVKAFLGNGTQPIDVP